MSVRLDQLPTRDLLDLLRYAATMASGAGIKRYEVKITKEELIIIPL